MPILSSGRHLLWLVMEGKIIVSSPTVQKPLISPTNQRFLMTKKCCDIVKNGDDITGSCASWIFGFLLRKLLSNINFI